VHEDAGTQAFSERGRHARRRDIISPSLPPSLSLSLSFHGKYVVIVEHWRNRFAGRRCVSIKFDMHSEIGERFMRLQRIARAARSSGARALFTQRSSFRFPDRLAERPLDGTRAREAARKIASGVKEGTERRKVKYSRDSPPRKMESSARQPRPLLSRNGEYKARAFSQRCAESADGRTRYFVFSEGSLSRDSSGIDTSLADPRG